eukprot:CAMPEP_0168168596 /NCGR_PEP_ID=MMETSP0139_2-20121125/3180_1 /TAXON_ID=44445 /ORGANISM="Pseudo-nitzschia australis, Strain 10249 10 AB" /LENGTH=283 /DNA_ID=CAMNT_0008085941 /DNA_START=132 /DNA_END=983 /DNA_ORIENTATION=+
MSAFIQATKKTETTGDEADAAFMSCGLDRSCPKSVTTAQDGSVRLDQYQSSITGNRNKRQRRQRESCPSFCNAKFTQPAVSTSTGRNLSIVPDHDFEWYDLDAIREAEGSSSSSSSSSSNNNNRPAIVVVRLDFNAGLIFTTERQVLGKGAEVNFLNSSINMKMNMNSSSKINASNEKAKDKTKQKKNGKEFENLFFWVATEPPPCVEETPFEKEEREFRERMVELEHEINTESSLSFALPGLSPLNHNHDETSKNESDSDDDSNGSDDFFASWRPGDPVIQL